MKRGRGRHRHIPKKRFGDDDDNDHLNFGIDDFSYRSRHGPFPEFHHCPHGWNHQRPFGPHGMRGMHGIHGPPIFSPNEPPPFHPHGDFSFPPPHGPPHGFPHFFPPHMNDFYQWHQYGPSYDYPEPNHFFQQRAMTQGYNEPKPNFPQRTFTETYNTNPNSNITINVNVNNEPKNLGADIQQLLRNRFSSNNYYNNYNNFEDLNNNQIHSSNSQQIVNPIEDYKDLNLNKISNSDENIPISQINNNDYAVDQINMEKNDGFKLKGKPTQNIIQNNVNNINNMPQEITNEENIIEDNQQESNNQQTNDEVIEKQLYESKTNDGAQIEDLLVSEVQTPDFEHNHELDYISNLKEICTFCHQIKGNKDGYKCNECEVILCKDCSDRVFFGKKKTTLHPHNPLALIYRNNYECANCHNTYTDSTSFSCEQCNYNACLSCYIPQLNK